MLVVVLVLVLVVVLVLVDDELVLVVVVEHTGQVFPHVSKPSGTSNTVIPKPPTTVPAVAQI